MRYGAFFLRLFTAVLDEVTATHKLKAGVLIGLVGGAREVADQVMRGVSKEPGGAGVAGDIYDLIIAQLTDTSSELKVPPAFSAALQHQPLGVQADLVAYRVMLAVTGADKDDLLQEVGNDQQLAGLLHSSLDQPSEDMGSWLREETYKLHEEANASGRALGFKTKRSVDSGTAAAQLALDASEAVTLHARYLVRPGGPLLQKVSSIVQGSEQLLRSKPELFSNAVESFKQLQSGLARLQGKFTEAAALHTLFEGLRTLSPFHPEVPTMADLAEAMAQALPKHEQEKVLGNMRRTFVVSISSMLVLGLLTGPATWPCTMLLSWSAQELWSARIRLPPK